MKITHYWFGYIVEDLQGNSVSQAFDTYEEAEAFRMAYES